MKIWIPGILMGLTLMIYCSKAENPNSPLKNEQFPKIVHNKAPLWGDEEKIKLEFIREIGELEGDNSELQFYRPWDMTTDKYGNFYIVDAGNQCIKVFDKDFNFISQFGSKGQGPGEFLFPSSIRIADSGDLYVMDNFKKDLQIFDNKGNVKSAELIDNMGFWIRKMLPGGKIATSRNRPDADKLIYITDKNYNVLRSFGERKVFVDNGMKSKGNNYDLALDNNRNIVIAFWAQNRIEKYDQKGNLLLKISRELPYGESESMELRNAGKANATLRRNEFSTNVQIDHKNRIWVTTLKDQEVRSKPGAMMFEVFDENGVLLTRINNDKIILVMKIRIFGDRFFLIDYKFNHVIYEYKIVGN